MDMWEVLSTHPASLCLFSHISRAEDLEEVLCLVRFGACRPTKAKNHTLRKKKIENLNYGCAYSIDLNQWWYFQPTVQLMWMVDNSAENRYPNLNRLIGLFNERSSILDRALSHSKHVTMNLGRDYKSGTQPQLMCLTYLTKNNVLHSSVTWHKYSHSFNKRW